MLSLYTRHQRLDVEFPGTTREATSNLVRLLHASGVTITYSRLTGAEAGAVIRAEIEAFELRGLPELEWKWFDYDTPVDLLERLAAHGFTPGEAETVMVAESSAIAGPSQGEIHLARDPADVLAVFDDVWPGRSSLESIQAQMDTNLFYLARVDGVPASVARLELTPGNPFAGLFGGSTRPAFRQRGLYTALVRARAQEAVRRGVAYLTVDARPTSRPILVKLGFRPLCTTVPMVRTATASAPGKTGSTTTSGS